MKFRPLIVCAAALMAGGFAGCVKKNSGIRDSGQSRLMDDSFAGQNKCNPDDHDRPFIVEWDATDMSSFEAMAADDIVFVKYEGCGLKVLAECKNDSIRGEQGAYKPPTWTTGQLETLDIHNEGELYAKLPLGQATLGARVSGGEKFHMEYYVAGTRNASRDAVYESDLEGRYGCEDATHFVYAYNLGAFALASANEMNIEAGGSAFGFGAGGKKSSGRSAEKKGGDLTSCSDSDATEIAGCKAPIRLSLRKIRPGESPEDTAMAKPDTEESLSAVAVVNDKIEMSEAAMAHWKSATEKLNSGDGKGCLKELNAHDKLNPKDKSENPKSALALTRAHCVMKAGKCDAGRTQARKALEITMGQYGPEQIDRTVDAYVGMYCQGSSMSDRDQMLAALTNLQNAAYMTKKDVKYCAANHKVASKLVGKVKPKDEDDRRIIDADKALYGMVPLCYQRAGDCKKARKAFDEFYPKEALAKMTDPELKKTIMTSGFESLVSKCKDKG